VLVAVLLLCPVAAAALAGSLAARLGAAERAVLVAAWALLVVAALASPVAAVHDPWTHYLHLRGALEDPVRLLDAWDRPGFTLLAAGPAALGIRPARVAAVATALVALAATARAARGFGLGRPWLAAALLLAQPDFFGQAASTMTELPFAAALALALVGVAEGRPWLVAAGLGWLGVTRPEGPAFTAMGALWLALAGRRIAPALASFLPLALWIGAGAVALGDPLWLVSTNPYRGLVSLRLEVAALGRSWFVGALWQSQGPALIGLELGGALLAVVGPARRLRLLLAPVAASFLLLTFLSIGPGEAWRESRYLVAIGPALALLAASAVDAALRASPRRAPPALLVAAAAAAAWSTSWQWSRIGVRTLGVVALIGTGALVAAALLWVARRRVSPAAALAVLLLAPVVAAPPGLLGRHREDLTMGVPSPSPARAAPAGVMGEVSQEGP
jgi:hypothetical protein